jgi:hypothetical protein
MTLGGGGSVYVHSGLLPEAIIKITGSGTGLSLSELLSFSNQ